MLSANVPNRKYVICALMVCVGVTFVNAATSTAQNSSGFGLTCKSVDPDEATKTRKMNIFMGSSEWEDEGGKIRKIRAVQDNGILLVGNGREMVIVRKNYGMVENDGEYSRIFTCRPGPVINMSADNKF